MIASRLRNPTGTLMIAAADALLIVASFVAAAYATLLIDPSLFFLEEGGALRLAPVVGIILAVMTAAGLYTRRPGIHRILRAQQLSLAAGMALVFEAVVSWFSTNAILPRDLMMLGVITSLFVLFLWRSLLDAIFHRFSTPRSILMLGGGETLTELAEHIGAHPELNLAVAGSVTGDAAEAVAPVLGSPENLESVIRNMKPDLIVAAADESQDRFPTRELLELHFAGRRIEQADSACEAICHRVSARDLRPSRVLFTRDFEPHAGHILIPIADRLIAGLFLIAGLPLVLIYCVISKAAGLRVIESRQCAGFRGAPFTTRRLIVRGKGRIARIMPALRLDRYPDLWNVLVGHMSIVGPRPVSVALDRELARVIPVYEYRRNAKPGIASWAHLHPEVRCPVPDALREVEYDLYYVRHQSPALYAFVLLHGLRQRMS